MPPPGVILGIESSCDETAAAVVSGGKDVLSNAIATQHALHERYDGVVPEIASRAHLEHMTPVVREALSTAGTTLEELDAIAVGNQPGLIGSLLVGVSTAKALAWSLGIPIIGVNHIHAHLYSGLLGEDGDAPLPAVGLVVSGGHTSLYTIDHPFTATCIGRTRDDAAGEAFDKVATILGLPWPGGPLLDQLAQAGRADAHAFPIADLGEGSLDFSFSGLKTAVLYAVRGHPVGRGSDAFLQGTHGDWSETEKADFAASFQHAAISAIVRKVEVALERHPDAQGLLIGGGVCANSRLRPALEETADRCGVELRLPPQAYCLDNAAMIAGLAHVRYATGSFDEYSITASARVEA